MVTNKAYKIWKTKGIRLLLPLALLWLNTQAQYDISFTQYMNNEMFINPAYTGTREATAITLLSRNQWVGFDGAPKTQTFTLHSPVQKNWGLGFSAMNEKIGITKQLKFLGSYGYQIKLNRMEKLSFGLSGGISSLKEDFASLNLKDQNDLAFPFGAGSAIAPQAGFGMYFYSKHYFAGFSIPRLIKNSIVSDGTIKLKNTAAPRHWHYYITAGYVKKISPDFKLKPTLMIKEVRGAPMQAEISVQGLLKQFCWLGISYRTGDAISVLTGLHLTSQLRVFYSYDYTINKLTNYNSGSHEITVGYDFARKKKPVISPRLF